MNGLCTAVNEETIFTPSIMTFQQNKLWHAESTQPGLPNSSLKPPCFIWKIWAQATWSVQGLLRIIAYVHLQCTKLKYKYIKTW